MIRWRHIDTQQPHITPESVHFLAEICDQKLNTRIAPYFSWTHAKKKKKFFFFLFTCWVAKEPEYTKMRLWLLLGALDPDFQAKLAPYSVAHVSHPIMSMVFNKKHPIDIEKGKTHKPVYVVSFSYNKSWKDWDEFACSNHESLCAFPLQMCLKRIHWRECCTILPIMNAAWALCVLM